MISISTGTLWPYGLDRIFKIAKQAGFESLELLLVSKNSNAFFDTWDDKYIKSLINRHNLPVSSIHAHFEFESGQGKLDDLVDLSNKIGAKRIIIHIPREDQKDYLEVFKKEYFSYKKDSPLLLAENVHIKKGKADPIYLKDTDFKKLPSMCFDVAHALRSGIDPKISISSLDNIFQIHLSDWDGEEDHMNILKRKAYYRELLSIRKIDAVCLELCPKIFKDIHDQEEIVKTLSEINKFVKDTIGSK